nr:MAG TPA: hypothetical protein [Caudoviricetes sp.]
MFQSHWCLRSQSKLHTCAHYLKLQKWTSHKVYYQQVMGRWCRNL